MSKEREFLKKLRYYASLLENDLRKELEELLAQPEPEQQPEAWIIVNKETGYRTQVSNLTPFLYHREIFEVIPLYTAPPVKSEQEHVGIVRTIGGYPDNSEHVVDWVCKYRDLKEGDRLYLAPQTHKSITGIEISNGFKADDEATHPYSYWAGVEFAEKHTVLEVGNESI